MDDTKILSPTELEAVEKKDPASLSTPELASITATILEPRLAEVVDGILESKKAKLIEDTSNETSRRILAEMPQKKNWAQDNLMSRSVINGVEHQHSRPDAIHALNFETYTKTQKAIFAARSASLNPGVETLNGDMLDIERKFFEDNNLLDTPCGKGMALLGLTPRHIYDYRDAHMKGRVAFSQSGVLARSDILGRTATLASGGGAYLAAVQYISQLIDAIVEADAFFAGARHVPVEWSTIKFPRLYRATADGTTGQRDLITNFGIKAEGTAPTEGVILFDNLQFDMSTIAGWIATSKELDSEAFISLRIELERIVRQQLIETIGYFSMQGSGSSQPLGLWKTKIGSSGTTAPHTVPADHDAQWDDVKTAKKLLGGPRSNWIDRSSIVLPKSSFMDFNTRKDGFMQYLMRDNSIDGLPPIQHVCASAGEAAILPLELYTFVENFAQTTVAFGYGEGKTLITEGELLYFISTRLDSKHIHHKITSNNKDDCGLVFMTGLNQ